MYYDRTSRVNNSYQRKSWNNTGVRQTQGSGGGGGRNEAVHRGYTNDLPLRMLVNAKYVGAIIGQGGSNIRQVTRESKARCVVDVTRTIREGSGNLVEKAINIYGNPENCSQACMKILEIVMRETQADANNNQGRAPDPELKLLAHNNLVGRLIGKGGSSIKKIMEDTSCTVFVSNINELSSFNMDRTVTVRGTPANIAKAESRISMKLRQCWEHDMNNTLDAMYNGSGHPLIGTPSHYGTESPLTGAYPPYAPYPPHYQQRGGSVPAAVNRSVTGGTSALMNTSVSSRVGGGGSQHQDNYIAANHYGQNNMNATVQTEVVHVWVPNTVVGALIGTKGAQIRQVMRVTGAHIRIESTKPEYHRQTGSATGTGNTGSSAVSAGNTGSAGNTASVTGTAVESGNTTATGTAVAVTNQKQQQQQQKDKGQQQQQEKDKDRERMERNSDRRVTITGTEVQQYKSQFWVFQRVCEHSFMFFDEVRLCTEVQVPSRMVGRIIGKKGQNVRELQRYTGAQVKIPDDSDGTANSEDTVVRIVGNFNASQAVQNRIRQLLYQFNGQPGMTSSYAPSNQHAAAAAAMGGENGVVAYSGGGGRRAEPLLHRSAGVGGGDRCYYPQSVNAVTNYHHAADQMIKAS